MLGGGGGCQLTWQPSASLLVIIALPFLLPLPAAAVHWRTLCESKDLDMQVCSADVARKGVSVACPAGRFRQQETTSRIHDLRT